MTQAKTSRTCALAILLFARAAAGQTAPAVAEISYVGSQLRIHALGSTLAEVLAKVAALTGVKIEVPAGADDERMPVVELGPGPARQILASLLSESNFDYLIQASDSNPDRLQSVLLMPRNKKGSETNGVDAVARPFRSPYARTAAAPAQQEEPPVPDTPVPAQPESVAATEAAPDPPVARMPLDQPNVAKPAPLSPPTNLNPQSINQQLQQMYQQRMQMIQQERQAAQPSPATPGGRGAS